MHQTKTTARTLFLGALAIGMIGMFVGAYFKNPWVMGSVPIFAMLSYVGFSLHTDRVLRHIQSFADSIYFMGFLFTLVSLVVSLRAFSIDDDIDTKTIIAAFAIAILTTIIGLGVRIFLVNFSPAIEESEAKAQLKLAASSDELSRQMDHLTQSTVGRLSAFNEVMDEILQSTRKAVQDSTEAYRQGLDGFMKDFQAAGRESGVALKDATEEVAEGFRRAEKQFQESLEKFREPQAELLDALKSPLATATTAMGKYNDQILELTGRQEKLQDAMMGLTGGVEILSAAAADMGGAAAEIKKLEKDIELARDVIQKLEQASTGLEASLANSVKAFKQFNDSMAHLSADSRREMQQLTRIREALLGQVDDAAKDLSLMQKNLVEAADFVRNSLRVRS